MKTEKKSDIVSENEEKRNIEEFLTLLHDSKEIHDFFRTMEEEACRRKAYICTYRIKDIESAIRTYKINKKALKDVHDYIGVWFILKDEKAILPIIDDLKGRFPDAEYIDFTDEESIYSPLVYIKWTPPLNYTILARETLIPNQISVPIEIRITWKEAYISDQAAYYAVHKNDNTTLSFEERKNLRNIVQHIMYKLALLNCRDYDFFEREKQISELEKVIEINHDFLKKNHNLCVKAAHVFGRTLYRYEHYYDILSDENIISDSIINDFLMKKFSEYLEIAEGDHVSRFHFAIQQLRNITYSEIKQVLKINF